MITLLNLPEAKTLTFQQLLNENPNGLLEIRKSLTFEEYRNQFGFDLNSGSVIFKSRHLNVLGGAKIGINIQKLQKTHWKKCLMLLLVRNKTLRLLLKLCIPT